MRRTIKNTDIAGRRNTQPAILRGTHLRPVESAGMFRLDPLPYAEDALAPVISSGAVATHYGKHHAGYVATLNKLASEHPQLSELDLGTLVRVAAGEDALKPLFNNAGQAWNHAFYWNSMSPRGARAPTGKLRTMIEASFGDMTGFNTAFHAAATGLFGSGWVWLVADGGELRIMQTSNAATPMTGGKTCLLTIDVWEHAYYLDYRNKRADYVTAWLDRLVNWEFAERNLG